MKLQALKVGEKGPAGGYIFYDKGRVSDGWRFLEAVKPILKRLSRFKEQELCSEYLRPACYSRIRRLVLAKQ